MAKQQQAATKASSSAKSKAPAKAPKQAKTLSKTQQEVVDKRKASKLLAQKGAQKKLSKAARNPKKVETGKQVSAKFKKERQEALRTSVFVKDAETSAAFPFPTANTLDTVRNQEAVEVWAVDALVEHPAFGPGKVTGHTETPGVVYVAFDADAGSVEGAMAAREIEGSELKILGVGFTKVEPESEKDHSLQTLTFADVPLFAPFVFKDKSYVKVGNSSAIRAYVQGTVAAPLVYLASPDDKLPKDAKVRMRQKDKVGAYAGPV